jgi:hypothetical protein
VSSNDSVGALSRRPFLRNTLFRFFFMRSEERFFIGTPHVFLPVSQVKIAVSSRIISVSGKVMIRDINIIHYGIALQV